MVDLILLLIIGVLLFFLIVATMAPLESLGWYAGWIGEKVDDAHTLDVLSEVEATKEPLPAELDHYIVYLSGIGSFTGSSVPMEELPFLAALQANLPGSIVINDVFPYSVTNVGLTGERLMSRAWQRIEAMRPVNPSSAWLYLVVVRNLFQVAVSADKRYGPVYNLGVAKEVWRTLLRHGYRPGSHKPVTLIGTSGGGQVAVGSATYMSYILEDTPLRVISMGGVVSSDEGLLHVDHFYHLYGTLDSTQALGEKVFPGRWPGAVNSAWHKAEAAGKITMIELGPFSHTGPGSMFDQGSVLPDGRRHFDVSLEKLTNVLVTFYDRPPVEPPVANGQAVAVSEMAVTADVAAPEAMQPDEDS
ncbi:MAG: hypothetical protein KDI79_01225 [Anaerolineae bacterium]|nr:hypothetical protein [Anaerolineae bacterium]